MHPDQCLQLFQFLRCQLVQSHLYDYRLIVIGCNPFQVKNYEAIEERLRDQKYTYHMNLMPFLKAEQFGEGLIFPWAYNPKRSQWAEGMHWSDIFGVSPKATRDWAATCLRE